MSFTKDSADLKKIKFLLELLNNNRYDINKHKRVTHITYGNIIQGKFALEKENLEEFMIKYCAAINDGIEYLTIMETQLEYGPIIIDIDLKRPSQNNSEISLENNSERLYDNNLILLLIKKYIEVIESYVIINKNEFRIGVFEKSRATDDGDICKDGFHIIFPDIVIDLNTRLLIRHSIVEICKAENIFDNYIESVDKIIDKAVTTSNAWLMYGSRKPVGYIYKLTKLYNYNLSIIHSIDNPILSTEEIIKYFSFNYNCKKKYNKKNANSLLDVTNSDVCAEVNKLGLNLQTNETQMFDDDMQKNMPKEIERAIVYSKLLNASRASSFEEWRNVGLALYNLSKHHKAEWNDSLLSAWIDFSKKCSSQFKKSEQGGCPKMWKTFKTPADKSLLTIRSLAYWAKLDNPKEYELYRSKELQDDIQKSASTVENLKSVDNTFTIATIFYSRYNERFICSSPDKNIWWEFKNHKWKTEGAYSSLITLLSTDFSNQYYKYAREISKKMISTDDPDERDKQKKKYDTIYKITNKLQNIDFKDKIIKEAKHIFHMSETNFMDKLDSNIYLIGFENGVYDLSQQKFRDGLPDDYISLSTKNDYIKYLPSRPYIGKITDFLYQILPNDDVRNYFICILSTCLCGSTKEEKFYVLTGCGSNGKSLINELMKFALGDYYMSCPIAMITSKRGKSNEAAPEKIRMKGKRCGVFQETDDGDKINVGVMKEFTGGDTILIRDLFKGAGEMIEFKPQMKYFLTCNQLPIIPSNDDGTWRRLRVIEFGSKFVDEPTKPNEFKINLNLKHEIQNWASDFISYLIFIYETVYLHTTYLKEPEQVMIKTQEYKSENDYYTEYIRENIIESMGSVILLVDITQHFKSWLKEAHSECKPPNNSDIKKNLPKLIIEICNGEILNTKSNSMLGIKNIAIQSQQMTQTSELDY